MDRAEATADGQRGEIVLILAVNYMSAFQVGLVIGGIVPLLSIVMERWAVDPVLIGANAAMASLGVIAVAPFAPMLISRFGLVPAISVGMIVCGAATLAMGLTESVSAWLALRFLAAAGLAVHWIISETWMSSVATARTRGRVLAAYVTFIAAGFAGGPLILSVIGTEGLFPFALFSVLIVLSAAPYLLVRRIVPRLELSGLGSPLMLLRGAPTVFATAACFGIVDAGLFTFLAVWGLRLGFPEEQALTLVSAFLGGAVLLQLPIGWVADRMNRRLLLLICAGGCVAGPVLTVLAHDTWMLLLVVLVLWGGLAGGIYTIGLALLGDRFGTGRLAAANAAFVMTFETTCLVGPPVAGVALRLWEPHGLMVLMGLAAVALFAITAARGLARTVD